MKRIVCFLLTSICSASVAFAAAPVTLSTPTPAIAAEYAGGASTTVTYTISNDVPYALPMTLGGLSGALARTPVTNDCGNLIPAGPSHCNIGVNINPSSAQTGTSVNQIMEINYQGRSPLKTPISFSISQFIYVSPAPFADQILQFSLNPNSGAFSSTPITAYTASSGQNFGQITFATIGGVQYGYAVNQNGYVYQCTLNPDASGTFNTCTSVAPVTPSAWQPYSIAITNINGIPYAYVTDVNMGSIYKCSIQVGGASNGAFNVCSTAGVSPIGFYAPYGINFATTNGIQYVYIADAGSGSGYGAIYKCDIDNSTGSFNSCTATPPSAPNWIPYNISFTSSNGTQYAYVADNGTGSNGNVYQCGLQNDGTLTACSIVPASGAPGPSWVPVAIAFTTLNGVQYAYIGNYQGSVLGGMYVCTVVNSSGADNGAFTNCNLTPTTPPIPWQPVGIAFR